MTPTITAVAPGPRRLGGWTAKFLTRPSPGRGAAAGRVAVAAGFLVSFLVSEARAHAQEPPPEKSTAYVPAFWFKSQVWDYFRRAPQFGWSFDIFLRTQGSYSDQNMFANRLRESYRLWFVWQINPLNRISIAPFSYHRDDGLRWNESVDRSRVRHELRGTVEFYGSVFLHKRVMLSQRYRLEGRGFYDDEFEGGDYFVRWRARLRLRYSLNDKSFFEHKVVYVFGYNEVGIHFGSKQLWAFNQNRAFLGMGVRFSHYSRIELGYINQYRGGAGSPQYHSNHGPMVYFMVDYLSADVGGLKAKRQTRLRRRAAAAKEPG